MDNEKDNVISMIGRIRKTNKDEEKQSDTEEFGNIIKKNQETQENMARERLAKNKSVLRAFRIKS